MLKIKLSRFGKKNAPTFRIIVAEARSKRDGYYLENLGSYNPNNQKDKFSYNKERYAQWIQKGAIPTESVKEMVEGKYEGSRTLVPRTFLKNTAPKKGPVEQKENKPEAKL